MHAGLHVLAILQSCREWAAGPTHGATERAEEPGHSGMGMTAAAGFVGLIGGACFLLLRRA